MSHDRYFMDKLCTKLLVFEGEGKIKEWVGSYTELRDRQRDEATRGKSVKEVVVEKEVKEMKGAKEEAPKKLTYAEKLELGKIDKEMALLEKKKEEVLLALSQSGADHHVIMERSVELERTTARLDQLTDRWLVLSEKV